MSDWIEMLWVVRGNLTTGDDRFRRAIGRLGDIDFHYIWRSLDLKAIQYKALNLDWRSSILGLS